MFRSKQLAVALLIVAAATAVYLIAITRRDFWDFEVFRTAAVRAIAGEPLYRADDGHYVFKYWPAFAFAVAPFAFLSPAAGKVLWFAGSIACLAGLIAVSIRALPDRRRSVTWLGWLTFLVLGKFIVREVVNGQTNSMLALLIVLAIVANQRRSPALSGVLATMAVFVKPYALLMMPWLAWTGGVRALVAAGVTLVAGLLLPALVYGWSGNIGLLRNWYAMVTGTTDENLLLAENISFVSMWAKWLGRSTTASLLAVTTTVVGLGMVGLVWSKRTQVTEPGYLEAGLLLLLIPLISPQGWDYVLLIAAPAFVVLLDRFRELTMPWRTIAGVGIALTSFAIYDLVGRTTYHALMDAAAPSVGALCLVAALVHLRRRAMA